MIIMPQKCLTKHVFLQYSIKNVTTNTEYRLRIRAASKSLYTGRLIYGEFSEIASVRVQPNCDKFHEYNMRHTTSELSVGVLAGVVCAGVAFFLAALAFIVWRYLIIFLI